MKSILPLFCFILLIFSQLSQAQTIRYVKTTGTQAAGTATSWANSTSDLQGAIDASGSGDQVWVAAGTYKPTTSTTDRNASFSMKNGVAIYGGFVGNELYLANRPTINPVNGQPASTTISGDIDNDGTLAGNSKGLFLNINLNATSILDGFVLTGGNYQNGTGGAMSNENCSPTVTNCSFIGNSAYYGGAMNNENNSNPVLTNCSFQSNTSLRGGAMYNYKGSATRNSPVLINCFFRANSASGEGGAIDNQDSYVTLINCGFLDNQTAGKGGAIFNYNSSLRVINGSFQNNTASSGGGAVYTFNSVATLTNSVAFGNGGSNTFTNQVDNAPSGVTASYSLFEPASVTVTGYTDAGNNLTTTTSPFASTTTVELSAFAPAIDAGSNTAYSSASGPTTDLNGQPRNYNGSVIDIGAIEYQGQGGVLASRLYVKANAMGANTGLNWQDAFTDLQSALNYSYSQSLTEIWVATGTYKPTTSTTDRNASFSMKNGVAIYGGFVGTEVNLSERPVINPVSGQPSSTTLSGDINNDGTLTGNSQHVISNAAGITTTAILNGFVITGGNATDSGGGMLNDQSNPTLINCSFLDNSASKGGAIYSNSSTSLVLTNCFFRANSASSEGGAINNQNSQVTLINCGFLNNQTPSLGGAILNYNSTLRVINGSWQNNTAFAGGAILTFNGVVTLTNCVAFGNGGDNTFTTYGNNTSGFTATYSLFEPSSLAVTGINVSGAGNLTTTNSPFTSTATVALNGCAPAINTGSNIAYSSANGPSTDLSGQPRYYNSGTIDMGAVEYQSTPSALTVSKPTVSNATMGSPFSQSFTASGGSSPYSFSLVSGSLPASLSLVSTGMLSGTPTQVGSYSMSVQARDVLGCVAQSSVYNLTVNNSPIRYVKSGASGSGNSWVDASGDLQSQINLSGAQQVWVAAGLYKPSTTDREASFSMKNGVAIYGGFRGNEVNLSDRPVSNPVSGQPSSTTLLGNNNNVIINTDLNATAILNGFVITGGNADFGGAMLNNNSSPMLTNLSFIGNSAAFYGGAMYNRSSSPMLTNCTFLSNTAQRGGAMYNQIGFDNQISSNPVLTNCSFSGNSASDEGGAIDNQNNSTILINCAFLANQANAGSGGAIFSYGSTLRVINGSFQNNTASTGGAIDTFNGVVTLTNCVAFGNGGSNTFTNQVNNGNPSGFTASYSLFEPASITVTGYTDGGHNLTTTTSPFTSTATVALNGCAPAINTGSNIAYSSANGPSTDLSGQPRYYNSGTIDMGAVEYQSTPSAISLSNPTVSNATVGSPFSQSFTASGGSSPYSFSLVSGSLPASLSLVSTGMLSGTPTQVGSYSMSVQARDVLGCVAQSSTYTLMVNSMPIRYVKSGASGSGNSWVDASGDLQSQINLSGAQQVWVAAGLYKPSTTDREASFSMKNGVAIYGGFMGNETALTDRHLSYPSSTTLSGDIDNDGTLTGNSYHVIKNAGGITTTALLNGFVVTGGNADGSSNSSASFGGGGMVNLNVSSPTVINCLFTGNYASLLGGAIFSQSSSTPVLINCGFLNNRSDRSGGAITNNGVNTVLINCSFQGNVAASFGQAIYSYADCSVSLINCVLWNNGTGNAITNFGTAITTSSYSLFAPGNFIDGPGNLTTTTSPFASTATLALNQCAPAINTGSNDAYTTANGPATDLSGQSRNYNGSVIDMGAVEFQGSPNLPAGFISSLVSGSALCVGATVTPSVSVSGSGPFTYQWYKDGSMVNGQITATLSLTNVQTSDGGSYSVVVTGSCNSVTSTAFSLTVNAIPTVSINPTSATLTIASPMVSLTAIGSGSYLWSTGETTQIISVTSSGTYSLTLTMPGGCTASASALVPGADLTVTLELPQAQFGSSGTAAIGNFIVNVFEVGGLATSSGNVTITITAPVGYTLSFVSSLTSIDVSGGSRMEVNNGVWTVNSSVDSRQLTLVMNSGAFIGAAGKSSLGLSITRTTANSGSASNITVNVGDDLTMRYDGNLANNVYARIISGL